MTDDAQGTDAHGPLHGIRVLEFSQIVAGPVAGLNLADLGADVIKVEPPGGDSHRNVGSVVPNESKMFQGNNRGKRGIVLDLHDPRAQDVIHRMAPRIDVVVINHRPGVAQRLRIDYETLREFRPDLIYLQLTGFGEQGPEAGRAGSDIVAQSYSGLMVTDGKREEDGAPALISIPISDYSAGFAGAMAVSAALFHRERTGEGQYITTSLLRLGLYLQNRTVMREPVADATIRDPMLARLAAAREGGASYDELAEIRAPGRRFASPFTLYYRAYRTRDGAVTLGALTPQNRAKIRLVLGIEHEELSDRPDFDARDPANVERVLEWKQWMRDTFLERSTAEWVAAFDAAGVPVAPVNFPEEMADDEQANADGMIWDLEHTITGPQRVVGPPVKMSKTPTGSHRASPALGEHTTEVLREFGIPNEEIAALVADGVASTMD